MRILHLSDTHGLHRKIKDLPIADVIIHSGDISHNGTEDEVLDFLNWFIELPYQHKIFVTGNHDLCQWDAFAKVFSEWPIIVLNDGDSISLTSSSKAERSINH